MTKKKALALLLTVAVMVGVFVIPSADTPSFSDVPTTHWAFNEIEQAVDKGITNGYADGTFKPANSVTKNQFAVMLSRAFFPEDVAANQEIDDGQPWYWANLKALNDRGLLEGTNLTDPDNWASRGGYSINRYEMAVLMYNILGEFGKSANAADMTAAQSKMSDWRFISPDYQDAVAACYALGVLSGYSDGTFSGEKPMNRAQGCVVIGRLEAFIEDGTTSTPTTEPENPGETTEPENPGTTENPGTSTGTTTGTLSNGKAITEENVLELLDEIREEFPKGTIYMEHGKYYESRAIPSLVGVLQAGCNGWASMCSDMIFGKGNANPARELADHSEIRPGDIICIYDKNTDDLEHAVLATSTLQPCDPYNCIPGGQCVTITESNSSHKVAWNDTTYHVFSMCEASADENGCYWVVYTRYPD